MALHSWYPQETPDPIRDAWEARDASERTATITLTLSPSEMEAVLDAAAHYDLTAITFVRVAALLMATASQDHARVERKPTGQVHITT